MTELAEIFTVLTGLIAVAAVLVSTAFIARGIIRIRLSTAKLKIGLKLAEIGSSPKGRTSTVRAIWRQAKALTAGDAYTVSDELLWISKTARLSSSFAQARHDSSEWLELVDLYRRYAAHLQIHTLLFGGSQPVLDQVAEVAQRTADVIERNANNIDVSQLQRKASRTTSLELQTGYCSPRDGSAGANPSLVYIGQYEVNERLISHDLCVSWVKGKSKRIAPKLAGDHSRQYNGLLPKLLGYRYEQDITNGNYRLHLELGEIFYSDHLASSSSSCTIKDEFPAGLLTLSVLPLTTDGYFIIAERGDLNLYPRCWGPGAGGNLEIPRLGSDIEDVDRDGVISPLLAVAREAKEELGVALDSSHIRAMGLGRIMNAEESGTWLLPTMAPTGLCVEEVSRATLSADAVAGRWEVGTYLAAVPVPQDGKEAERLVSWALRNKKAMPHLTISIVKLVSLLTVPVRPEDIAPHSSDQDELPPGSRKFRFGVSLPV